MRRVPSPRALWLAALPAFLFAAPAVFAQGFGGTVQDHLVRGDSLLAQGKSSEAIVQFQEARTLCPTPAETVSALQGEAQGRMAQNEALPAVGLLQEAATRFPDDPRASNLLFQGGIAAQRGGDLDKAIEMFRGAMDRKATPDILPVLKFHLAMALRLRGRPGEVVELLKDFEKEHPEHNLLPNVLYTMAIAQHDLGTGNHERSRLEESAALYKRLIEKFPGRPAAIEAHYELGLVLSELGHRAEAGDYFSKYASLNPTSAIAARSLERAGDMTLLFSPKHSAELYALAQVKAKANQPPSDPSMALSRWLTAKKSLAETISRVWVLAILAVLVLAAVVLIGRLIVNRVRRRAVPAGA